MSKMKKKNDVILNISKNFPILDHQLDVIEEHN